MTRSTRATRAETEAGKTGGSRPATLSAAALEHVPAGTAAPITLGTATNAFFTILR
ncbi:hypothetical protein ACFOGJ_27360 [Marinibaculum pumilum]|uniref:Uncharacterized protein n=1 Tax=Marinibaculum pumilum TaxID=1766165 RepID=A0ABV7L8M7_9PROT